MHLARGGSRGELEGTNSTAMKRPRVQPLAASGEPPCRPIAVALDSVGAGVGENVFFVRCCEAAFPFYPAEPPTDADDSSDRGLLAHRVRFG